jgi:ribonuclease HII
VVLDARRPIPGLADSKQVAPARRTALAALIRAHATGWAIACAEPAEIDALNILQATLLAMRRAVLALGAAPTAIWVDGNQLPELAGLGVPLRAVVGGDATVAAISAASILAKTARDAVMIRLAGEYPGYGFERHMGYPTAEHLQALARLGPCPAHRRTFGPVRRALARHG